MSDKYTFLTQAPVHRVIGAMAIPTIISMLLTSMYNLVDTFFVGKINTQSTAAVGIVFSVMFFIQAFSFFFGNGSGNYISRQLGAQNTKDAEVMASTGLIAGGEAVKDLVNLAHTMRIRPEDEATSEPARIARESAEKILEEHKRIKAEKAAADK